MVGELPPIGFILRLDHTVGMGLIFNWGHSIGSNLSPGN